MLKRMTHSELQKSFAVRLVELARGLQVVSDAVLALRAGRAHQVIPLSGQLRALLTDTTKHAGPLLLDIAAHFGETIEVFLMPEVGDLPQVLQRTVTMHIAGFPISLHRQLPSQRRVTIEEFLNHRLLRHGETSFSVRTVIDWYANRAGGAHYSRSLPAALATLQALPLGPNPLVSLLTQLGEAALLAGRTLLKRIVDLEFHSLVAIPRQVPQKPVYLFDAQCPGTPMRLSFRLNSALVPTFVAFGLQGLGVAVEADRLIDWREPRHLEGSVLIEDDLTTLVSLYVDGERVAHARHPEALLTMSDPADYEMLQNKAVDSDPQDFSMGVAEIVLLSTEADREQAAQLQVYLAEKRRAPALAVTHYGPFGFAHKPLGSSEWKITQPATLSTVAALHLT